MDLVVGLLKMEKFTKLAYIIIVKDTTSTNKLG